jgi:hypothetical protein
VILPDAPVNIPVFAKMIACHPAMVIAAETILQIERDPPSGPERGLSFVIHKLIG